MLRRVTWMLAAAAMTGGLFWAADVTLRGVGAADPRAKKAASSRVGPPPVAAIPGKTFSAPYFHLVQYDGPQAELVESTDYLNAVEARNQFNVDGSGLTAAVLDTGLLTSHNDFTGKVLAQKNYTSNNFGNPNNADDGHGHGTNVAGIICANGPHTGFAPGANVIPMKVLSNIGSGQFSWMAEALDWVIDNHEQYDISVVNMSVGDSGNYSTESQASDSENIRDRIQQLRDLRIAVCIAAGNSFYGYNSEGMAFPGIIRESVSVGAIYDADIGQVSYGDGSIAYTTDAGRICVFSQRLHESTNANTRTDIFATGAALTSAGIMNDNASSTMHGTSQATPSTAGLILLAQEYYKRETGQLPTIDDLERWLRLSTHLNVDGDDEDDNATNTGKTFIQADALELLQAIEDEIGGGGCTLRNIARQLPSSLKALLPRGGLVGCLPAVRGFRDDVLKSTPEGRQLAALYYSHATELTALCLTHPQLMAEATQLVADLTPVMDHARHSEAARVSQHDWQRGLKLIDGFDSHASAELQQSLGQLQNFLKARAVERGNVVELRLRD
jgi:subtilisin family serine protease